MSWPYGRRIHQPQKASEKLTRSFRWGRGYRNKIKKKKKIEKTKFVALWIAIFAHHTKFYMHRILHLTFGIDRFVFSRISQNNQTDDYFFAVVIMLRMYYSDRIQIHWNTCCSFERFWFVIRVRVNCCYFWYWNISKFIRLFKNVNHFWSHFLKNSLF